MTRLILIRFGAALLLGLGLLWGAAGPALAQTMTNHECARRAVRSGLILPLGSILARVRMRVRGRLVGVTLRGCRGGPWIYRIRMLTDQGRVAVIRADARTGRILGIRGAGRIYRNYQPGYRNQPGYGNQPRYGGRQRNRRFRPWYRRQR